jgi:integrase/recombinase XerD
MKLNRTGQASYVTKQQYACIRHNMLKESHKTILDIQYYTGERASAVCQLTVGNVYTTDMFVRDTMLFPGATRKDGHTREVPVHEELRVLLQRYADGTILDRYLFESIRDPDTHIPFDTYDNSLRMGIEKAGLVHLGISTHSMRVSFITNLAKNNTPLPVIAEITGHSKIQNVARYVATTFDQKKAAISCL